MTLYVPHCLLALGLPQALPVLSLPLPNPAALVLGLIPGAFLGTLET